MDVYFVIYAPACEDCPGMFVAVPGSTTSYTPPITGMGITPSEDDLIFVLGFDMPSDFNADEYNPMRMIGYKSSSMNLWTNVDVIGLLGDLFGD